MFKIEKRTIEEIHIINLIGRLVTSEAYKLEDELDYMLNKKDHLRLIFDLSKMEYCSSYGLRIFIKIQNKAQKHKGLFILFNPGKNFKELLEIAGLQDYFDIKTNIIELFKEL